MMTETGVTGSLLCNSAGKQKYMDTYFIHVHNVARDQALKVFTVFTKLSGQLVCQKTAALYIKGGVSDILASTFLCTY